MGCGSGRISSSNQTIIQPISIKDPIQDSKHTSETIIQENINTDSSKRHENYVDIKINDFEAYNDSFIKQRQKAIDNQSYRTIIESWHSNSLEQLIETMKLFSNEKSLIDRYWIIFYWITYNIKFDIVSYFKKINNTQTIEKLFQLKKGLSYEYANLYKYLCDQLNISCEIINGYSKTYPFDNQEYIPIEINHIWNAIKIDHYWYLIEPTWATGFLTEQKIFQYQLQSYYFCPYPNEMIYHHFPNNNNWQLLQKTINLKQYLQMPKLYPNYFKFNLELINSYYQNDIYLIPNKSYALVLIRSSSHVQLQSDLKLNNQIIDYSHRILYDNEKKIYYCYFAPIGIGNYKITIYGKQDNTEYNIYNPIISLTLNVKEILQKPISYPKISKSFSDFNLKLISPQDTHLIKLSNGITHTEIQIQTPIDVILNGYLENENNEIITHGHLINYDKYNQIWLCKFAPNSNGIFQAIITAKKKIDIVDYTPVISFKIDANQIPIPPISYPKIWQIFYDLDMKIIKPKNQGKIILLENENELEIHIETSNQIDLLGYLINHNQENIEHGYQIFYDRNKNIWRCKFAPNNNGIFHAEILVKKKFNNENFQPAILFQIDAKQISIPFLSYPYTWQLFHDFNLKIITPQNVSNTLWSENSSYTEIRMQAPNNIQLSCQIQYNNIEIKNGALAQFDNNKQEWQLLFAPQQIGLHKLIIYGQSQLHRKNLFDAVVQFDLNVSKLQKSIIFPLIYTKFQSNKCQIYEPINGILKKNAYIQIHCLIPNAIEVDIQIDSQWINTQDCQNSLLKTNINVGSKNVIIYAKFEEKSNYDGLIQYFVQ